MRDPRRGGVRFALGAALQLCMAAGTAWGEPARPAAPPESAKTDDAVAAPVVPVIIEPGVYRNEARLSVPHRGLALVADEAGARLTECDVARSEKTADDERQVLVACASGGDAILIVAGVEELTSGPVNAASLPEPEGDDGATTVSFRGTDYAFAVRDYKKDETGQKEFIVLQGRRVQALLRFPGRDSASVRWAGDLDRDGRLDCYVQISHHNYHVEGALYLSSRGSGKKFFGPPIRFSAQKLD